MTSKLPIAFFGSGPVAAASLRLLARSFAVEVVFTKPRPAGHRGPVPVLEVAEELNLPVLTAANRAELSAVVAAQTFTSRLAVLIDFGIIVAQDVIDSFELIIFTGIVAGLPHAIGATAEQARQGELHILLLLLLGLIVFAVTYFVVFVERGQRRIVVSSAAHAPLPHTDRFANRFNNFRINKNGIERLKFWAIRCWFNADNAERNALAHLRCRNANAVFFLEQCIAHVFDERLYIVR
jgi:hypothetical protein